MQVRVLGLGDEARLEAFLAAHADASMFLRSNLAAGGIVDGGERFQATYAAALDGGYVTAVAAHCWNRHVVLMAPSHLDEVVSAAVGATGRPVAGIVGPWAQVTAARAALGLVDAPAQLASREELFALALDDLVAPPEPGRVRRAWFAGEEGELLVAWRAAYHVEALGAAPGDPANVAVVRAEVEVGCADGRLFVLIVDGRPASVAGFNARVPDCVQIGGVYTPPELRGRGYARAVVAGALAEARAEGTRRAVLFTGEDNAPARRSYLAIGFRVVGDYGLVRFA